MRIAIYGTGGVGGYFGGRLAQAGEEVVFIARGEHLKALQAKGLHVNSIKGDFHISPTHATDRPDQVGEVDAVLVCVKAWQVPEAARAIKPMIGRDSFAVPLENGVEAPGQLTAELGKEHVLGGLCQIVSFISAPGEISHTGIDPFISFGELDNRVTARARRLKEAFDRVGVRSEIPADIQAALWDKFLFIVAISGVGAVTRAPAGVIRKLPQTRAMLEGVMKEVKAVAEAQQVHLPDDVVQKKMAFIDSLPESATASMQRDILSGKPSELEAQNGAVVRLGAKDGVATPVNSFIYSSLLPQELRARNQVQ
ncbi:MAG: 2-dehydropantoate 2-reductase [Omnitrophica WOR_2 bacterium]